MLNLYWGLFIAGIVLSILSLIFSGLGDWMNLDFDFGDMHLPIRPFFILIFLTVFSGTGIIATIFVGQFLAVVPAFVAGLCVAKPLDYLINVKLRRYETYTASDRDAVGVKATVIDAILAGSYGRISFVINGNTLSGAAKEYGKAGNGFPQGAIVTIAEVSGGVYYVADGMPDGLPTEPENAEFGNRSQTF